MDRSKRKHYVRRGDFFYHGKTCKWQKNCQLEIWKLFATWILFGNVYLLGLKKSNSSTLPEGVQMTKNPHLQMWYFCQFKFCPNRRNHFRKGNQWMPTFYSVGMKIGPTL